LPLMQEAGVAATSNPIINITIQGRHDTYPRRRGLTRIPEMRAIGIPVALGQDCVMDPWYGLGKADMLDVAYMAVHAVPMTSRDAIRWSSDAVTKIPAAHLGLEGYGLDVGCNADFVMLQATDPIEAIRLRADRLLVVRRGAVIAEAPAKVIKLTLPGRPSHVDPVAFAPKIAGDSALRVARAG
jgi:cytosine/creatinine deaminase